MLVNILSLLFFAIATFAQVKINDSDLFLKFKSPTNYIVNPHAEKGTNGITVSAGGSISTAGFNLDNKSFLIDLSSSTQTVKFDCRGAPPARFLNGNIEIGFVYRTTAFSGNDYTYYVEDTLGNIVSPIWNLASTDGQPITIVKWFQPGSSLFNYRLVFKGNVADPANFSLDNVYLGDINNSSLFLSPWNSGVVDAGPITIGATTTAPTKASSPTKDKVLYSKNGKLGFFKYTFRNGATTTGSAAGSGDYLYSLPAGLSFDSNFVDFHTTVGGTADGNYWRIYGTASVTHDGNTHSQSGGIIPYDSTRFRIMISNNGAQTGFFGSAFYNQTLVNMGWEVEFSVPIAGWSAGQVAQSPLQTDYGMTSYTPIFTGWGTVASPQCYHSRRGEYLNLDCRWTNGTTTATEARVSLPNSLNVSSKFASSSICGSYANSAGGSSSYPVICTGGQTYVTFAVNNLTNVNGNTFATSSIMSLSAKIPITGWDETLRAATYAGSVTSGSNRAIRTEFLTFAGASAVTNCSSSPCTLYNESTVGWATVTRSATGIYSINPVSGVFSSPPNCQFRSANDGGVYGLGTTTAPTSTAIPLRINNSASQAAQDGAMAVLCMGFY